MNCGGSRILRCPPDCKACDTGCVDGLCSGCEECCLACPDCDFDAPTCRTCGGTGLGALLPVCERCEAVGWTDDRGRTWCHPCRDVLQIEVFRAELARAAAARRCAHLLSMSQAVRS